MQPIQPSQCKVRKKQKWILGSLTGELSSKTIYVPGSKLPCFFHITGDGYQPNSRGLYTHYKDFPSQGFDDVRLPFPLPPLLTMLTYYQAKWCGTIRGEITPNYLWLLANPHKKPMIFHHTWKTLHGGNLPSGPHSGNIAILNVSFPGMS